MKDAFQPSQHELPYQPLGHQLKQMRERHQESLAEVSGAVEINIDDLERIEAGQDRPSEDILSLLINHFEAQEYEAVQLWNLAGYDGFVPLRNDGPTGETGRQPAVMIIAVDVRTMYSDTAQISANEAGVVLQFSQTAINGQTNVPVARVGMSFEQAQQVLDSLQLTLLQAKYMRGPKGLPPKKS